MRELISLQGSNTRVKNMKNIAILTLLVSLSACSVFKGKGDAVVFDTVLGPNAKEQAKSLPSDLRGDSDNARHSSDTLIGNNMGAAK